MLELKVVLLIDDDFTTNYLHKKIISKLEIDVPIEVAENGKEGIEKLLALNETLNDTDDLVLIFLDINMPVMDGWEFLETLKGIKSMLSYTVNLFVVSSSINPDDIVRATREAQVLDYLSKPLTLAKLAKLNYT
ncbi:MAG: CheY-like chemotaxis protein [Flavobacteriales bacterium]|jgi:CheY-like chemotaxis protein